MASWYVEYLVTHSEEIRSGINTAPETYFDTGIPYTINTIHHDERSDEWYVEEPCYEIDFDSSAFTNLLIVEKIIDKLVVDRKITPLEKLIVSLYASSTPMEDMIKQTGLLSKITIMKIFSKVCDRISYVLGGEFTDEGYISRLCEDYKLTEEQVQKVRNYFERNVGVKNI